MSWDDIKSDSDMRIDVNELRDFSNSDVVEKAEVNGEVRFFFFKKVSLHGSDFDFFRSATTNLTQIVQ